jgi:hypothetical protein
MTYNKNKGGVDTFDHMVEINTCRRKTQRWPFNVFMFILDCASQNAFSLSLMKKKDEFDLTRVKQQSLQKLAFYLINYNVVDRMQKANDTDFRGYR